MNMKTAYKVYLFCCVLFLTGLFLLVPVYAVEDMWTAASRIIKKMTPIRTMIFVRADRTAIGHQVEITYIANITI